MPNGWHFSVFMMFACLFDLLSMDLLTRVLDYGKIIIIEHFDMELCWRDIICYATTYLNKVLFLNFKYSRGDPHCKDFIKKSNKKNNTTVQIGSGGQEGARGLQLRELHSLYKQKQDQQKFS